MRDDELRARLTALADATAPPPRADLAAVVERRHRARRRSRLALGAVTAVVAAVAVAVPQLAPGRPAGEPATAIAEAPASGSPTPADGLGEPARGSLAGDAAFVEGVLRLSWTAPGAAGPPAAGAQVLFAGDVPGGRWVLLARPLSVPPPLMDDDHLGRELGAGSGALAWFAGPPGAAPAELRLRTASVVPGPAVPAAVRDEATGTLAVVAPAPAVTARVVDGNGRPLAELTLTDGLGVQTAPEGTVEVLAADGTVLASVRPLAGREG